MKYLRTVGAISDSSESDTRDFGGHIPSYRRNKWKPDLLPVRVNGKCGYIDLKGTLKIPPTFIFAEDFAEGLAAVLPDLPNPKWGFVDSSGTIVIPPAFDQVGGWFSEGLANVEVNKKWGFVDKAGTLVVPTKYDSAFPFSDGLAVVSLNDKAGFIDKSGSEILPLQYESAWFYSEGTASVRLNGRNFYIDRSGKQSIPGNFAQAGPFQEGRAWFQSAVGQPLGYIDSTGTVVASPQFEWAFLFSEGLALAHVGGSSGHWLYIDRFGKDVFKKKFKHVEYPGSEFSEGLAGIAPDDKFGFIDNKGKLVIDPQFENVGPFRGNVASVQVKSPARGYIDSNGHFIWKPSW